MLIIIIIGLGIISWGAFNIHSNLFLSATHQGNAENQQVALTFDDGPNPTYTPQVLELLDKHNAKATFFCIGKSVERYPYIVKQIREAGHTVGNHSYTHGPTIDLHRKKYWLSELRQTDSAIAQAIGRSPRFFRPPYGVTTPHLAKALRQSGHRVIGWRVRPYDTLESRSSARIVRTILRKVKPGAIILLHDSHSRIVPALEQLLPQLRQRGYTLVTVAKLIDEDAYV
ncbi:polysaccharide deacetylase family protein [Parapedobacter soli]|uniref:polysaccharide deacetylase family protein n=1 Tax=Parapedobacter soli TaxID=416955 RepID=UPI0021C9EC3F|nr:polysaccharide deacetylase family protein [Parapedobacter soli]